METSKQHRAKEDTDSACRDEQAYKVTDGHDECLALMDWGRCMVERRSHKTRPEVALNELRMKLRISFPFPLLSSRAYPLAASHLETPFE